MEEQLSRLASKAWGRCQDTPLNTRLIIGISGIPGSGKTTFASIFVNQLNALVGKPVAVLCSMDGYHYTRAQLSAMPDPETAHLRRGAAFTFDAASFVNLVRRIREPVTPETQTILAPSFDHAVKDPVDDGISIPATARIVVLEGNYLSLNKDEWKELRDLIDESWFVEVDDDVARERVAQRHFKAGIADSVEAGRERFNKIDLANGKEVRDNKGRIDETIYSNEDDSYKPEALATEH